MIGKVKKAFVKLLYFFGFRKVFLALNRVLIRRVTPRIARIMQLFFKLKKGKIVSCSTAGVSNVQFYLLLRELRRFEGWTSMRRYNEYNRYSLITKLFRLPYHLATAEVVIVEDIYRPIKYLKRDNGQVIIQTWHALGAFKKFGRALAKNLERLENEDQNEVAFSHRYHYFLDPGQRFREKYCDSFYPGCKALEQVFNPRVDLLFNDEYIKLRNQRIFELYPGLKDRRVILYAPTYRGFSKRKDASHFMNFDLFLDNMPEDVIVALKRHPSMMKSRYFRPEERNEQKFIDVSKVNINDLLQISDCLITDYSSVFFEGAILNKPCYFLVKDFDQYLDDRGFYFDLRDFVPGPLCRDEVELAEAIKDEVSKGRSAEFVKEYFGEVPRDNAKRFAEFIVEYCKSRGTDLKPTDAEEMKFETILDMTETQLGSYLSNEVRKIREKG